MINEPILQQRDSITAESARGLPHLPRKHISWSAVAAGVLIAVVLQISFSLLGIGIGASTVDPLKEQSPLSGLGMGSGIWLAITTFVSLFVGGWVAGRFSEVSLRVECALHGLLAWAVTTVLTVFLLSSAAGGLIGGTFRMLGQGGALLGQAAGAAAPQVGELVRKGLESNGVDLSAIKNDAEKIAGSVRMGSPMSLQAIEAERELPGLVQRLFAEGNTTISEKDKQSAVTFLMTRANMSREEAEQTLEKWTAAAAQAQAKFEEAKAKAEAQAREAGDAAARGIAKAGIWGFFALLLGAIAAAGGGVVGSKNKLAGVSNDWRSDVARVNR